MPRFRTVDPLPPATIDKVTPGLQASTNALTGLYLAAKLAHWNVRGPLFGTLHALFGKVADAAGEHADATAERLAQLGEAVAPVAESPQMPDSADGAPLCDALAAFVTDALRTLAEARDVANDAGDIDTFDILTDASRALSKLGWQVAAHTENTDEKAPVRAESPDDPGPAVRPEAAA